MVVSATLDNTIGALFVGLIPSTVLYGATCLQAWNYFFSYPKDPKWMKAMVSCVLISDTVNFALITASVYDYVISHFGNPAYLATANREIIIEVIPNAFTAIMVQGFFIWRIWMLKSPKRLYLCAPLAFLAGLHFVVKFVWAGVSLGLTFYVDSPKVWTGVSTAIGALADVSISIVLCCVLNSRRTTDEKTNWMINRIILFALNTGLITAATAVVTSITYYALPSALVYVGVYFLLGRIYANSLLATLNAREYIRRRSNTDDGLSDEELASTPGPVQTIGGTGRAAKRHSDIAVTVDLARAGELKAAAVFEVKAQKMV